MADIEGRTAADNDQAMIPAEELRLAARALIEIRAALRSDGLPGEILGDAPLDMLLALYVGEASGEAMLDDVTAATPAPPVVSQRWLSALQDMGLVDRRGARVLLTAEGKNKIAAAMGIVIERYRLLVADHPPA